MILTKGAPIDLPDITFTEAVKLQKEHWKTLEKVRENSRHGIDTALNLAQYATLSSFGYIKFKNTGWKITPAGRKALEAYKKETR